MGDTNGPERLPDSETEERLALMLSFKEATTLLGFLLVIKIQMENKGLKEHPRLDYLVKEVELIVRELLPSDKPEFKIYPSNFKG